MLTNKATLYLAKISAYGFLIHSVVFRYLRNLIAIIFRNEKTELFLFNYGWIICLSVGMIATVFFCELWIKIQSRIRGKNIT